MGYRSLNTPKLTRPKASPVTVTRIDPQTGEVLGRSRHAAYRAPAMKRIAERTRPRRGRTGTPRRMPVLSCAVPETCVGRWPGASSAHGDACGSGSRRPASGRHCEVGSPVSRVPSSRATARSYARDLCSMHYQRMRRHGDPHAVKLSTSAVSATSNASTARSPWTPETNCHVWTAALDRDGYGLFRDKAADGFTTRRAHRCSYERHVGPIPDGMTIDHRCGRRACVNPDHLEAVPAAVNQQRARASTRSRRRMSELGLSPGPATYTKYHETILPPVTQSVTAIVEHAPTSNVT